MSSSDTMRLLAVLSTILVQCVATKSWTNDSKRKLGSLIPVQKLFAPFSSADYSEETFSVFGWITYLKRISLIALMLCGVILYYVPESRPRE